jgi:hypothetical protein
LPRVDPIGNCTIAMSEVNIWGGAGDLHQIITSDTMIPGGNILILGLTGSLEQRRRGEPGGHILRGCCSKHCPHIKLPSTNLFGNGRAVQRSDNQPAAFSTNCLPMPCATGLELSSTRPKHLGNARNGSLR